MKLGLVGLGLTLAAAGCIHALSPQDVSSLDDIERLTLLAYERAEGGARALDRGAFCSAQAVLWRQDAGTYDAGTEIVCSKPGDRE